MMKYLLFLALLSTSLMSSADPYNFDDLAKPSNSSEQKIFPLKGVLSDSRNSLSNIDNQERAAFDGVLERNRQYNEKMKICGPQCAVLRNNTDRQDCISRCLGSFN